MKNILTFEDSNYKLISCPSRIIIKDDLNRIIGQIIDQTIAEVEPNLTNLNVSFAQEDKLFVYIKNPERKKGVYDLGQKKILFLLSNFSPSLILGNSVYQKGLKIIQYNYVSGIENTVFEANKISSEHSFEKILGERGDALFTIMSDGTLCKINMKSKDYKIWKLFDERFLSHKLRNTENLEPWYMTELGAYSLNSATYLQDKNLIVGFEYGVYWELDLETEKLNAQSMFEEFDNNNVCGCWSSVIVRGDIMYFFSDQAFDENQNHKLVGFNLKTKKIISQWGLPQKGLRRGFEITGPKLLGLNLIAAIEQDTTCHLFIDDLSTTTTS